MQEVIIMAEAIRAMPMNLKMFFIVFNVFRLIILIVSFFYFKVQKYELFLIWR